MKRIVLSLFLVTLLSLSLFPQNKTDYSGIDLMLINGNFKKAIDTCSQILVYDSLNAEIYYKQGLAYQNLIAEDKSFDCFLKAATISPDNKDYNFTLAKSYLNKGKSNRAQPILEKLCSSDTMNWPYAYYLTGIYMQEEKYNESLKIYYRFYKKDYYNYNLVDKIGFAYLRKGDFDPAIDMFERSLKINPKNINAIKNLAYLYAGIVSADTAVKLLTTGIKIDSSDMDLYARRAAINFSRKSYIRALDDYLKLINSGDSSFLNLKRTGIGYGKSGKPKESVRYLLKAYSRDTSDMEVMSYLAQNYGQIKDYRKSAYYTKKLISSLTVFEKQLGLNYLLLGEELKSDNQYTDAINAYLKSQEYRSDNSVLMIVANLYDEKLKDIPKAIHYYEMYLNKLKTSKSRYDTDYTESIRKRIESLKKQNQN